MFSFRTQDKSTFIACFFNPINVWRNRFNLRRLFKLIFQIMKFWNCHINYRFQSETRRCHFFLFVCKLTFDFLYAVYKMNFSFRCFKIFDDPFSLLDTLILLNSALDFNFNIFKFNFLNLLFFIHLTQKSFNKTRKESCLIF